MAMQKDQGAKALLGAFVADAASVGLHWLYDKERLNSLDETELAFRKPDPDLYEGAFGYFAHEGKEVGSLSHYGSSLQLMLKHLFEGGGHFNLKEFQRSYRSYYGPGGKYIGFIDNPTRLTLENLTKYDYQMVEQAKEIARDLPEDVASVVVQKVLPYLRKYSGRDLIKPITDAIEVTYKEPEVLDLALKMAETLDGSYFAASGADDQQIPALSFVPALTFLANGSEGLTEIVEQAIRVTNHNDIAVGCGVFFSQILLAVSTGEKLDSAISKSISTLPKELHHNVDRIDIEGPKTIFDIANHFGRTCYLTEALPLALYILRRANSYREAVEMNILSGGDSCGRSLVVGSLAALQYGISGENGIPRDWINKSMLSSDTWNYLAVK